MRAFPIVVARAVAESAAFYESLGFERHFAFPEGDAPGYVGLRRGESDLGIVAAEWPEQQYGERVGGGVRFELFVYVDDVEATVARLGARVLREPQDMPWGERVAYVADPDGNPVALAH